MPAVERVVAVEEPDVEFDPYTPVTVTWRRYLELLARPGYVRCRRGENLLELKVHPEARDLVECVLVSVGEVETLEGTVTDSNPEDQAVVPVFESEALTSGDFPDLRVVVRDDALELCLSGEPASHWVGTGSVVFGLAEDKALSAILIAWDPEVRRAFLRNFAPR